MQSSHNLLNFFNLKDYFSMCICNELLISYTVEIFSRISENKNTRPLSREIASKSSH